jgi:nucleoside-diphosphate-sugar epimerase
MTTYTVLGASGFVGGELCQALQGKELFTPIRLAMPEYLRQLKEQHLGTVFYCVGMTANFRQQPFATIDANLSLLRTILETCEFDSLVYLSSTRVYSGSAQTDEEAILSFRPQDPDHLYNLSKAMAESLCLNCDRNVKVARLANVYGKRMQIHNFLASLLLEAVNTRIVRIRTAPSSVKDYIAIEDVSRYLLALAQSGKQRVYNLASGMNISHQAIADTLRGLGIAVEFTAAAQDVRYPQISTQRLFHEFGQNTRHVLDDIADLLHYQKQMNIDKAK